MEEYWRESPAAPDYLVSNLGRVRRRTAARGAQALKILKPFLPPHKGARPTVTIRVAGKTQTFRVCSLVIEAFKGSKPHPSHECCHNDGNPENNAESNLRWGTRSSNHQDKWAHGTMLAREKGSNAKLTEAQVGEIKARAATGEMQRIIALDYGIAQGHVSRLVRGVSWK